MVEGRTLYTCDFDWLKEGRTLYTRDFDWLKEGRTLYTRDFDWLKEGRTLYTRDLLFHPGSNGDNSTLLADTYLGAGSQSIPVSIYSSTMNGYPTHLSVSEGCIPVGASFHGMDEGGSGFYSTLDGIS